MLFHGFIRRTWVRLLSLSLLVVSGPGGPLLYAQEDGEVASPPPAAGDPKAADAKQELPPPKLPKKQEFTAAEMQRECKKFEGRFIAYYDKIYKVEKCKRREVLSTDDQPNPVLNGAKIQSVEGVSVAKIPAGEPIEIDSPRSKPNCLRLEGRYILSRGDDIYFIEKCKKRFIPDWDTYAEHAQKRGKRGLEVFELGEAEFNAIKAGEPIQSVLDAEYKKLLDADKGADVIPLQEACKGLNGKFVTYYSRIYRIEGCRKRSVDPEAFMLKNSHMKLDELSSEQWISIPNGKAYKL